MRFVKMDKDFFGKQQTEASSNTAALGLRLSRD